MKKTIFLRIFSIFIATAIFIGCSKEGLSVNDSGKTGGVTKTVPDHNYGGITGKLSPVPSYAAIKVYNDAENFGTSTFPDINGNFRVSNLIPGIYRVVVIYIPQGAPSESEYKYFEIRGVIVEEVKVTDLGEIMLPPE